MASSRLLSEELSGEKMRYTLELKEKRVKERSSRPRPSKVRREKAAEAAALEQVIAAQARKDEAMKHVLPLQAEGDRAAPARGRGAQVAPHQPPRARRRRAIEAAAEAEARRSWPRRRPIAWR